MSPRLLLMDAGWRLAFLGGALVAVALALALGGALDMRGVAIALLAYGVVATAVLAGLAHHDHDRFGPANAVTLTRATFTALLIGLLGAGRGFSESGRWVLVAAGGAALALDGIDGWLARKSRLQSAFGARFDMESDALFVLALSALVYRVGQVGPWVLTAGLLRYIFVLAGWLWPPLAAPLPPSQRRRVVCVILILALLAALAPVVDMPIARGVCFVALVLLLYSFGADCVHLAAAARRRGVPAPG